MTEEQGEATLREELERDAWAAYNSRQGHDSYSIGTPAEMEPAATAVEAGL